MNTENLIPMNQRTKSEQREISRKGGIASGESRRKRKILRDQLIATLEYRNAKDLMCQSLIEKAMQGDIRAFEVIRDTIGENPKMLHDEELREERKNDQGYNTKEKDAQKTYGVK